MFKINDVYSTTAKYTKETIYVVSKTTFLMLINILTIVLGKIFGISYLNKCFVTHIKTSTSDTIAYGCLVNYPNIEKQICGINVTSDEGTSVKGII